MEIISYRNLGEISEIFAIFDMASVTYGGRNCKEKNSGAHDKRMNVFHNKIYILN